MKLKKSLLVLLIFPLIAGCEALPVLAGVAAAAALAGLLSTTGGSKKKSAAKQALEKKVQPAKAPAPAPVTVLHGKPSVVRGTPPRIIKGAPLAKDLLFRGAPASKPELIRGTAPSEAVPGTAPAPAKGAGDAAKKPVPTPAPVTFEAFASDMNLDAGQRVKMKKMLIQTQREGLQVFGRTLPDGTNMLDELVKATMAAAGDPGKEKVAFQQFRNRWNTTKVPGTGKTFLELEKEMNHRLSQDFQGLLRRDQAEKFKSSGIQPTDIQLQEGPVFEYIQARLKKG
ncbi:MAG: hypothetical protein ACYTHM_09010 [Planctomycetota bacterium]|jgi:hypothetical protein